MTDGHGPGWCGRPPSEAQLSVLWAGQRFPPGALVTRHGVPVRVISQGRAGRGPGPDFRGAVIAGPSGLALRGDVELHVRSSSFRAHGHSADAAYANVILHVVFEDDTGDDTPLPGGRRAPVVALAPWVARRAGELDRWLTQPSLWQEPCRDSTERLGEAAVHAAVEAQADARFDARVERYRSRAAAAGVDQSVYEGLLEALGYSANTAAMRGLALALPWAALNERAEPAADSREVFEALLLGAAGLLPSQRGDDRASPQADRLQALWAETGLRSLPQRTWRTAGVRPANAPSRRLAGAAALLARASAPRDLLAIPAGGARALIAALCVTAQAPWLDSYDLCAPPCALPTALIGRSRALEIALNVVLPAAAALGAPDVAARARECYRALPRGASYGATRFLERTLPTPPSGRAGARRAQGLLALHRDWCTQNGCGRCPLS